MRDDLEVVQKNTDTIPQINEELKAARKTTDATLGDKGHEGRYPTWICHEFQTDAVRYQGDKRTPGDALSEAKIRNHLSTPIEHKYSHSYSFLEIEPRSSRMWREGSCC